MVKQQFLVAVMSLSSFLCFSASAQSPALGTRSGNPKDKAVEDKYRSDEIERVRRSTLKSEDRPISRFPQIKEDFERIQMINSDVLQSNSTRRQFDYQRISKAAGEVGKRATRLKSNLFSPSKEGEKQIESQTEGAQDLKSLLQALDNAIVGFVHNPIFENIKLVNPNDSSRAQQDLERIIRISKKVSKRAKERDR